MPIAPDSESATKPAHPGLQDPAPGGKAAGVLADVLFVLRREKKLWLTPLILLVVVIAALLIFAALEGPAVSFVYPQF